MEGLKIQLTAGKTPCVGDLSFTSSLPPFRYPASDSAASSPWAAGSFCLLPPFTGVLGLKQWFKAGFRDPGSGSLLEAGRQHCSAWVGGWEVGRDDFSHRVCANSGLPFYHGVPVNLSSNCYERLK